MEKNIHSTKIHWPSVPARYHSRDWGCRNAPVFTWPHLVEPPSISRPLRWGRLLAHTKKKLQLPSPLVPGHCIALLPSSLSPTHPETQCYVPTNRARVPDTPVLCPAARSTPPLSAAPVPGGGHRQAGQRAQPCSPVPGEHAF